MSELINNLKESLEFATETHKDMEEGGLAHSCREIYLNLLIGTIKMHECIESGKRYVACVAIKTQDGKVYNLPRPARHGNLFSLIHPKNRRFCATQGFLDNEGNFLNRVEARELAEKSDQLLPRDGGLDELYSEDVW